MSVKSLRKRVEKIAQSAGVSPPADYLPRFPRTLDGASRYVLEWYAGDALKAGKAKSPCGDVERAADSELLAVLGYSPDRWGLLVFQHAAQHWIAKIMHNFKLAHNCGEYCPQKREVFGKPFVEGAAVFWPEYERLAAEYAERKRRREKAAVGSDVGRTESG